jgi:hypothetical protein
MRHVVATILTVAIVASFGTAHATTAVKGNCKVTAVAFDQHLFVTCANDSALYFGYTSAEKPSCSSPTTVTIDTLKIWQSMLLSAMLAGRPVDLYFATGQSNCSDSGTNFIFNVAVK